MLTCVDAAGSGVGTAAVTVGAVPAPTVSLSVSPSTVQPGQVAALVWSSTNDTACTASGGDGADKWPGARGTSGTFNVTAPTTTGIYSYVLSCSGPGGSGAGTTTLTVSTAAVPTVTINANPTTVAVGGSSALTWSSTNVTACTASGAWSGGEPTANPAPSFPVGPFTSASVNVYTLTCGGDNGSASASATVTAGTPPPPTVTISVQPASIQPGQSATLTWSSTNDTSCTASGSWSGPEPLSSSASTGILSTAGAYSYTLVCSGPSGSTAATALLTVSGASVADDCAVGAPSTALLTPTYKPTGLVTGLCLLCSVSQPQNVTDADLSNYAVLNAPVGLLNGAVSLAVSPVTLPNAGFPIGRRVGFVLSSANAQELLTLDLLQSVSVSTLIGGAGGTVQDTAGATASSPIRLDLLTLLGSDAEVFVSFPATKPFDTVLVTDTALAAVISQVNVRRACVYNQ